MIGLGAFARVVGMFVLATASAATGQAATVMKSAAPMPPEETINRPDCPIDETSSGRLACRLTDAGKG
jgi:hypothetical protein